jgi:hypothetical protein
MVSTGSQDYFPERMQTRVGTQKDSTNRKDNQQFFSLLVVFSVFHVANIWEGLVDVCLIYPQFD